MKFVIPLSFFLLLSFFPSLLFANENSARKDTCELASLLIKEGSQAGIDKIGDMFSWDEGAAKKAKDGFSILNEFQYIDGKVYVVANFGGLLEQHLLVLATKENGVQYFHFSYEKYKNAILMVHVEFDNEYKNIIAKTGAFPQRPEKIDC